MVDQFEHITHRLDGIERHLQAITQTLQTVAVQEERLTNLQGQVVVLFTKCDEINRDIRKTQRVQDSCPIKTIYRLVWAFQIPNSAAIVAVGLKAFGVL